jgi:glycosyltransferase involved in cell wall biosynthesis
MKRRVLLASYEVAGLGGASTSTYALFRKMWHDGLDVHLVNLVDGFDVPYLQYVLGPNYGNPKLLASVHNCVLTHPRQRRHEALARLVDDVSPDVVLARGDIAAVLLRLAAPSARLIYAAAGCQQVGFQMAQGRVDSALAILNRRPSTARAPALISGRESEAIASADLILVCSDLLKALLDHFLPYWHACKVFPDAIWSAEWIHEAAGAECVVAPPFAERSIDVLFVASSWSRVEKNLPMVRRIAASLPGFHIGIVGECDQPVPGATSYGFVVDSARVLAIMADAKALVCPSGFDASPGILFEASRIGCNVVASRNCGNWMLCHEDLLVDPFTEEGFVEAARRAVRRKYPDNMSRFLEEGSYARLLDVLAAL